MTKKFDWSYIENELKRADSELRSPVTVYVVGGSVLARLLPKLRTKDVDVVTEGQPSVGALIDALRRLEYGEPEAELDESGRGMEYVMIENRDSFRWDIFDRVIAGKLVLSERMKERAGPLFKGTMLTAMGLSKEDVFLMKGVSDREKDWEKDMEDMERLASAGLNYDVVLEECKLQSKLTGKFWEPALYNACVELKDNYYVDVPFLDRLKKLVKEGEGR